MQLRNSNAGLVPAGQYLRIFLVTAASVFLGVSATNLAVDPYRFFRVSSWQGFNRVKPYASHEERLGKAYLAEWIRAKGLILGNSRAEVGLDPAHPAWPVKPVLNLAVAGTALAQSAAYLRHASEFEKPDLVILGVDFMDFRIATGERLPATEEPASALRATAGDYDLAIYPDGQENHSYTWNKWKNRFLKTGSLDAFWHSLGTVFYQNYPYAEDLTELGFNPLRDYQAIVRREGYHATFRQKDIANSRIYGQGAKEVFLSGRRSSPVFDRFRDIVQFCDARGIRLVVVIYPYHAHLLEIFRSADLWPKFEDWKRQLLAIVESAGGETATLWDFSGYTRFSTESVPGEREKNRVVQWYWEAGHFKKELGDLILTRIFGADSAGASETRDFGRRLTSENIEDHLADMRRAQARYRSAHPLEVAELERLVSSR